jgi:hypothetical protein
MDRCAEFADSGVYPLATQDQPSRDLEWCGCITDADDPERLRHHSPELLDNGDEQILGGGHDCARSGAR